MVVAIIQHVPVLNSRFTHWPLKSASVQTKRWPFARLAFVVRIVLETRQSYSLLDITLREGYSFHSEAQALCNGSAVGVNGDTKSQCGRVKSGTKGDWEKAEGRNEVRDLHIIECSKGGLFRTEVQAVVFRSAV